MMNTNVTEEKRPIGMTPIAGSTARAAYKRTLLIAAAILAAVVPAIAQAGGELQEKLAAVKQSTAENQQKLHGYEWTETTQLALKGDPKPPSQASCVYGPDGKVQKTPLTAPPPPPSGGRMKQKVIAKKKEEMKDYMGQVKVLLAKYVPPDPQSMQQAFQGESLVGSQSKFRRDADGVQRLCPARRPDDALLRHSSEKNFHGKDRHIPG